MSGQEGCGSSGQNWRVVWHFHCSTLFLWVSLSFPYFFQLGIGLEFCSPAYRIWNKKIQIVLVSSEVRRILNICFCQSLEFFPRIAFWRKQDKLSQLTVAIHLWNSYSYYILTNLTAIYPFLLRRYLLISSHLIFVFPSKVSWEC